MTSYPKTAAVLHGALELHVFAAALPAHIKLVDGSAQTPSAGVSKRAALAARCRLSNRGTCNAQREERNDRSPSFQRACYFLLEGVRGPLEGVDDPEEKPHLSALVSARLHYVVVVLD